jgi:hypothetical protein
MSMLRTKTLESYAASELEKKTVAFLKDLFELRGGDRKVLDGFKKQQIIDMIILQNGKTISIEDKPSMTQQVDQMSEAQAKARLKELLAKSGAKAAKVAPVARKGYTAYLNELRAVDAKYAVSGFGFVKCIEDSYANMTADAKNRFGQKIASLKRNVGGDVGLGVVLEFGKWLNLFLEQ